MKMTSLIPSYLTEKKSIIQFLLFTAVFSFIFINIYKPFGADTWKDLSNTRFFLYSGVVVLSGVLVLIVSRIIMFQSRKKYPLTYFYYFLWLFIEILVLSLIYSFLTKYVLGENRDFIMILSNTILYTFLILLLPYAVSWLYLALQDSQKILNNITKEDTFIDFSNGKNDNVNFKDEKGNLKLSVRQDNLLFIESADNYVEIYYLNKGKLSRFVIRTSLKSIEDSYSSSTLIRCHRSYMINFKKVKVLRKDKDGIFLELDIENIKDIPVSKTYAEKVTLLFSKHSV